MFTNVTDKTLDSIYRLSVRASGDSTASAIFRQMARGRSRIVLLTHSGRSATLMINRSGNRVLLFTN